MDEEKKVEADPERGEGNCFGNSFFRPPRQRPPALASFLQLVVFISEFTAVGPLSPPPGPPSVSSLLP